MTRFGVETSIGPVYLGECRIYPLVGTDNILVPLHGQVALRNTNSMELCHMVGPSLESDDASQMKITAMYGFESTIIVARSSGLIEIYDLNISYIEPVRSWKSSQNSSISFITCQRGIAAVGFTDGQIRLFDVSNGSCLATLKGQHRAPVSFILFLGTDSILSAGEDGSILNLDISNKKGTVTKALSSHKSAVTSLAMDSKHIVSASRDGTIVFYDMSLCVVKCHSVTEAVEDVCMVREGLFGFVGSNGAARYISSQGMVKASEPLVSTGQILLQIIPLLESIWIVSSDYTVFSLEVPSLKLTKTFLGNLGEITDIQCSLSGKVIVSSGDSDLKLLDCPSSLSCQLLKGHSESIISVAVCGDIIVTGSRDKSIRLWTIAESESFFCGLGHTEAVSAVAIVEATKEHLYIASGSSDLTIKLWQLNLQSRSVANLWTLKAHDKDINALCFASPQVLLSCSQDKSIKVWNVLKGTPLGPPLMGHKRGVWCVSCHSDLVVSGSSDKTIRVWSLSSRSCIKTLEGHSNSVLRLLVFSNGTGLISTDSDGLLKVWDIKKGSCTDTFDHHHDRIWALALLPQDISFITGDALGVRSIWRDASAELAEKEAADLAIVRRNEQELANLLSRKDFLASLRITFSMDQPGRSLMLISRLIHELGYNGCHSVLKQIIKESDPNELERLLKWVREWNLNFKRSVSANMLLYAILECHPLATLSEDIKSIRAISSDVCPYIDRHMKKFDDLTTSSYMADFALSHMSSH